MEFIGRSQSFADVAAKGWKLVIPAVTVGNVGQLAVDVLLNTGKYEHVGRLRSTDVLPVVGMAPSVPTHLSEVVTALEVYASSNLSKEPGLVIVQQRAPTAKGRAREFSKAVTEWAFANGCSELVVLAGANAAGRRDAQLRSDDIVSTKLRYACTTNVLESQGQIANKLAELGWKPIEGGDVRGWSPSDEQDLEEDLLEGRPRMPAFLPTTRHGSFTRSVLELCEEQSHAASVLLIFVHEGDNYMDGCFMASAVSLLLSLELPGGPAESGTSQDAIEGTSSVIAQSAVKWEIPRSWQPSTEPPVGLY